jgi:hypothetical protein
MPLQWTSTELANLLIKFYLTENRPKKKKKKTGAGLVKIQKYNEYLQEINNLASFLLS